LNDAADFLEKEGAIEKSPPWSAFRRAINHGFVEEIKGKLDAVHRIKAAAIGIRRSADRHSNGGHHALRF
jgi:hypothetical protein